MSDLREAHERGFISKLPCHNSVLNALESADLTPILRALITESSRPLQAVEVDFAVDSTGFTTCRFESWFDHKYGESAPRRQHTWVKAHVMCGVKTNVVTAIEIHERDAHDAPMLPALVNATAQNFAIAERAPDPHGTPPPATVGRRNFRPSGGERQGAVSNRTVGCGDLTGTLVGQILAYWSASPGIQAQEGEAMARMSRWMVDLAIVLTLLGSVASTPAQNFGMADGEKYFTIDWERGEYKGRPSVRGHIANRWGLAITDLRVKVEGLDAAGTVTSTTIDRVPGDVTPGSRGYFEILVPPAPNYRVSLSTYSMIDGGGAGGGGGGGGGSGGGGGM